MPMTEAAAAVKGWKSCYLVTITYLILDLISYSVHVHSPLISLRWATPSPRVLFAGVAQ